jgi:hypothetical protein
MVIPQKGCKEVKEYVFLSESSSLVWYVVKVYKHTNFFETCSSWRLQQTPRLHDKSYKMADSSSVSTTPQNEQSVFSSTFTPLFLISF